MCGIAGICAYRESAPPVDEQELLRIREAMIHRGPDGAGLWISPDRRVGLAHRRLAIIDLSEAGAQPMATADGNLRITFNGEIYNYRELRKALEAKGYRFRSNSDTEVLLHLYAECGEEMVNRLRGMYAFGIWNEQKRELFLARDPFGIKPLYYADDGQTLRFASQVKALIAGGVVDTAPEPAGSVGFLLWGCVPEPFTLYRGICALPAGSWLMLRFGSAPLRKEHFNVREELVRAQENAKAFRPQEREALAETLRDSVRHHLVSDVPVASFLSAGVDSTVVTALAAEDRNAVLRTLTLGFEEYRGTPNDEAPLAERTAAACGTRHATHWIRRTDFESEVKAILAAMDQPSTDGVNTYLVCRAAARDGIKVALSGLGGDELFGGYPSFRQVPRLARWLWPARHLRLAGRFTRFCTAPLFSASTSPKFAGLLEYGGSFERAYLLRRALFMPWELDGLLDPVAVHVGLDRLQTLSKLKNAFDGLRAPHARVAALEVSWYMRNQLLRDADWAGMAHSVEVRVPLVDTSLFRALAPWLVSRVPPKKVDLGMAPKAPLGDEFVRRPKSGFSVPVGEWLVTAAERPSDAARGLRGWAQRVLPPQPKQIRALLLVTDAFGGHGGIAKFNRDLAGALAAAPGCAEVIVVPRLVPSVMEPIPPGVRFLAQAAGRKSRFVFFAASATMEGPYDIVIAGHLNLVVLGTFLGWLNRARTALVIHGIDAWWPHSSRLVRACLSSVDCIIGVSNLTFERFNRWAHVDPSRYRLLPNCVDMGKFTPGPKPTALARQLGIDGRTVIMTLGRLASEERYKGFDEVIEVLPELARSIPDIVYLVCGDGPDHARLEAKAAGLQVGDRVVFTGSVPEATKVEYYRLADAYVMPSRGEGFGIVFLEALACGIPALGSQADGGREALLNGALGVLVDPSKPEELLSGILQALNRQRGAVPEKLEHYSSAAFSQRVEAIAREIMAAC